MTIEIDDNEITNVMYAATLLMSKLDSLTSNYYKCINCSIEESSASGGFRYRFEFESIKAERIISISYSPPTNKTALHSFNVSIDDYKDNSVSLRTLIDDKELYEGINYLNLKNYKGDIKQKIQGVVEFIDKAFSKDFPKIINGEEWEDIGFDWQGYK